MNANWNSLVKRLYINNIPRTFCHSFHSSRKLKLESTIWPTDEPPIARNHSPREMTSLSTINSFRILHVSLFFPIIFPSIIFILPPVSPYSYRLGLITARSSPAFCIAHVFSYIVIKSLLLLLHRHAAYTDIVRRRATLQLACSIHPNDSSSRYYSSQRNTQIRVQVHRSKRE